MRVTAASVLATIHRHPLRTLEVCLIAALVAALFTKTVPPSTTATVQSLSALRGSYAHALPSTSLHTRASKQLEDALSKQGRVSVFESHDVQEAPTPKLDVAGLQPGQSLDFHDNRGDIYITKIGDDVRVNMYRTIAGAMRSGDLHNCTQFDVILRGAARLRMKDMASGRDDDALYGANELIVIPPRVPHVFTFTAETYMLEWWDCEFQAWFYKPYRDAIDAAIAANAPAV